jgi:hypothetical protein
VSGGEGEEEVGGREREGRAEVEMGRRGGDGELKRRWGGSEMT